MDAVCGSLRRLLKQRGLARLTVVCQPSLAPLLRTEWAGLWTMLALSFANILLAVWRPRINRFSRD